MMSSSDAPGARIRRAGTERDHGNSEHGDDTAHGALRRVRNRRIGCHDDLGVASSEFTVIGGYWHDVGMPLSHLAEPITQLGSADAARADGADRSPALDSQEPAAARATRAELAPEPTEDCHEIRDVDAGGVPARFYRPGAADTPPGLLLFYHGGGWVIGDLDSHDNICRSLTNRSGHAVLSVDYRLAPEYPFPAGLED